MTKEEENDIWLEIIQKHKLPDEILPVSDELKSWIVSIYMSGLLYGRYS